MHKHHCYGKHEYLIPEKVLEADVIINLPKPKTHRKAGMTACMKNFVGINAKKEYLPHHRSGSIYSNGDEFPEKSITKTILSNLMKYSYLHNRIIWLVSGCLRKILNKTNKTKYLEGSWYGNDTIWRTILDINKVVLYADKNGTMTNKRQRIVFNIADMIVSGEKEGPLLPSDKKVGLLVASFNQLNMDETICEIMGFPPDRIKYINNGYKLKKYKISDRKYNRYIDGKKSNINKCIKRFIPTDGWNEFLLKK